MAPARIREYFHTVKAHKNMWTGDSEAKHVSRAGDSGGSIQVHLAGVNNSSHSSTPMHVSVVLITASPNGTLTYLPISEHASNFSGRGKL